jgi:hypothetical protein
MCGTYCVITEIERMCSCICVTFARCKLQVSEYANKSTYLNVNARTFVSIKMKPVFLTNNYSHAHAHECSRKTTFK